MLPTTLLACLSLIRAHGSLAASTQKLLLPWLGDNIAEGPDASKMTFRLRHLHALHPDTHTNVFRDVRHDDSSFTSEPALSLRTTRMSVHRPKSLSDFHAARTRSRRWGQTMWVGWDEEEIDGPDITDNKTLLLLAKMTSDAYISPGDSGWYDLGEKWNVVRRMLHFCVFCTFHSCVAQMV
jgi:lipase ATG15